MSGNPEKIPVSSGGNPEKIPVSSAVLLPESGNTEKIPISSAVPPPDRGNSEKIPVSGAVPPSDSGNPDSGNSEKISVSSTVLPSDSGNPEKIPISSAVPPLCYDLVELDILPRLPVKALMRLKCVSRQWDGIISRPRHEFIYLQSLHAASCLLENRVHAPICLSRDPRSVGIPNIVKQIKPLMVWASRIVASCNGLLCCSDGDPGMHLAIGNPSINNWKLIPFIKRHFWEDNDWEKLYAFGLAVDVESSVRYTLLLLVTDKNNKFDIFIFSSTTEQWRVISDQSVLPVEAYLDKDQVAVYVEDCLYWMVVKSQDWEYKNDCGVFWFNIGDNLYGLHPLPDGSDYPMHGGLGEYGGRISYAVIKAGDIHVWSLDHQGWSKKFLITLDILANTHYQRVICFEGGDHLSFCIDGTVYSLDTLADTLDKLADGDTLTGILNMRADGYNVWVPYRNTLVSLPLEHQRNEGKSTI